MIKSIISACFVVLFFVNVNTTVYAQVDTSDSCVCSAMSESGETSVDTPCSKPANTAVCLGASLVCECRINLQCGEPGAYVCPGTTVCNDGNPPRDYDGICRDNTIPPEEEDFNLCNNLPGTDTDTATAKGKCTQCLGSSPENRGIWTAVGCIKTSPDAFIADFLKIALGIAGGIALLLMIYGAFLVSVSAGDPKKAEEGKEIITGTIAGLLFIIFSVFLLKLIGVDILQIPGL